MSGFKDWSTTANNNNSTPPNGAPEGMAPSDVNDCLRQNMAAARYEKENAQWFDWGDTPTYISTSSFSMVGNVTARYEVGQAIRCTVSGVDYYGHIETSAYTSLTTVTLSITSLTASLTAVAPSILIVANTGLPKLINATHIANGAVSNAEFQYLDGVTSAIQTQLNAKAASSGNATLTGAETLTNKEIVVASNTITTAASGNLTSTNLNSALAELQTDIDTRALSSFRGCLVFRSGAYNLTNNTDASIPFDAEAYDTDAIHDLVTNTERLTVPSGVTRIKLTASAKIAASGAGRRNINISKNGGLYAGYAFKSEQSPSASVAARINCITPVLTVTAGDYFWVVVNQDSGGTLALGVDATGYSTWFAMEIIE